MVTQTATTTTCSSCDWSHDPTSKSLPHNQAARHTTKTGHATSTTVRPVKR